MADPIRVRVREARNGRQLIQIFARRGLIAELVANGEQWAVEIRSPCEETRRLLDDVEPALEFWLAEQDRPEITLQVGQRSYVHVASTEARMKGEDDGNDREMESVA